MITGGFTVFRGGWVAGVAVRVGGSRVVAGLQGVLLAGGGWFWLAWVPGWWLAGGCCLLSWFPDCSAGGWRSAAPRLNVPVASRFPGVVLSRLAGGGLHGCGDWLLPVLVGCCSLVPAGLLGSRFRGGWRVTAPSMVGRSRCGSPWFGWRVLILSVPAHGSMFLWWLLVGGCSLGCWIAWLFDSGGVLLVPLDSFWRSRCDSPWFG